MSKGEGEHNFQLNILVRQKSKYKQIFWITEGVKQNAR